jgi:hypothetical protein
MLFAELSAGTGYTRLRTLKIARLSDRSYSIGNKCFFPSTDVDHDDVLPRIDKEVYSLGRNRTQQENARKLLVEIGVREVGEAEEIEAVLKRRYATAAAKPQASDLDRFIGLVEKDSGKGVLFTNHFIFEGADGTWHTPAQIFLDAPFQNTGLGVYYAAVPNEARRFGLAEGYRRRGVDIRRLLKFASAVGVKTRLEITGTTCHSNPEWTRLRSVGGSQTIHAIDQDYTIEYLSQVLQKPTVDLSRLIWGTMATLSPATNVLRATYRNNRTWGAYNADSQLVHILRAAKWIPQADGSFVCPTDASRDLLPEGFPFDQGWNWLKVIGFGEHAIRESQEEQAKQQAAKDLGFADPKTLERARRFASLPPEEQERVLAAHSDQSTNELPDKEPANPERRATRVAEEALKAPRRETNQLMRSVSVEREGVKQETEQYLREQYTNADGELICQICKKRMPFRLDSGVDYFEKVEFLIELKRRHYQNYLALCPNHAAMFQHANGSRDSLREKLMTMTENEFPLLLAQTDTNAYFTKTHVLDLRAIIGAEATAQGNGESHTDCPRSAEH